MTPPAGEVPDGWRVDLATDERGETAAVILYLRNKYVVELLKWNDLRINGVKMDLPFENSEMIAQVFCGMIQLTTTMGVALTFDRNGQVEVSGPSNDENIPYEIPDVWLPGEDRNDGQCTHPSDCLDNPKCRNHPLCDPNCKGDGCNHPNCKNDPRCPKIEREETPKTDGNYNFNESYTMNH